MAGPPAAAVSSLIGALVGGLASFGGTFLTQRRQFERDQQARVYSIHDRHYALLRGAYAELYTALALHYIPPIKFIDEINKIYENAEQRLDSAEGLVALEPDAMRDGSLAKDILDTLHRLREILYNQRSGQYTWYAQLSDHDKERMQHDTGH